MGTGVPLLPGDATGSEAGSLLKGLRSGCGTWYLLLLPLLLIINYFKPPARWGQTLEISKQVSGVRKILAFRSQLGGGPSSVASS